MAELKTSRNDGNVDDFLNSVTDQRRRADALALRDLIAETRGEEPAMWGTNIVGFGERTLRYASGRELDWFDVGFSPRKQALTLYLSGELESYQELLGELGPHTTGKGCVYIKRLDDVDHEVLRKLVRPSVS